MAGSASELVSRSAGVLSERVAGETVLLDPKTERYARLNRSAGVLWDALAEPVTVEALTIALAGAAGIERERARTDVLSFVRELRSRGLVHVDASG